MAASLEAAILEAKAREGERFDRATGYVPPPPIPRPTPARISNAFEPVNQHLIDALVRWLVVRERSTEADAWDATQDTFEALLRKQPNFFERDLQHWWPELCHAARYQLRRIKSARRRVVLTDSRVEPAGTAVPNGERSALPHSPAACDYTWIELPLAGEAWRALQILSALQRFTRDHDKPPREIDCRPLHRLPRLAVIRSQFGSFGAALEKAGIRGRGRRRFTAIEAAKVCDSFHRRHGRWPDSVDFYYRSEGLPGTGTAKRIFGSTRSGVVGGVVEAILREESEPAACKP